MDKFTHITPAGRFIGFNFADLVAAIDQHERDSDACIVSLPDTEYRVLADLDTPPAQPATHAATFGSVQ